MQLRECSKKRKFFDDDVDVIGVLRKKDGRSRKKVIMPVSKRQKRGIKVEEGGGNDCDSHEENMIYDAKKYEEALKKDLRFGVCCVCDWEGSLSKLMRREEIYNSKFGRMSVQEIIENSSLPKLYAAIASSYDLGDESIRWPCRSYRQEWFEKFDVDGTNKCSRYVCSSCIVRMRKRRSRSSCTTGKGENELPAEKEHESGSECDDVTENENEFSFLPFLTCFMAIF
jgi:hypothetical protein